MFFVFILTYAAVGPLRGGYIVLRHRLRKPDIATHLKQYLLFFSLTCCKHLIQSVLKYLRCQTQFFLENLFCAPPPPEDFLYFQAKFLSEVLCSSVLERSALTFCVIICLLLKRPPVTLTCFLADYCSVAFFFLFFF